MEFRDLKRQYQVLKDAIQAEMNQVLQAGQYISGPQVAELENQLANYVGVKHCIACANGTDALSLVAMAWGWGENDAVFVPDFTFFATAEIVSFEGATPIFVDVDLETFNICPDSLEQAIQAVLKEGKLTPKAIIPVDLFGLPANYPAILEIAEKYGLKVLEDGAQGFGGSINGQKACSFGHAATTSFFPAKPLGCYGDGGAIFTNDDELATLLRSLRVHGKGDFKYDNVRVGMNSRLDTLQAAILKVKLKAFIEYELEQVNQVALRYTQQLQNHYLVPTIPQGYVSSFAQYTLRLESESQRNQLQEKLKAVGIPTMVYYPKGMSQQAVYSQSKKYVSLNNTELLAKTVLSLPIDPYKTTEEIELVIKQLI